MQAVCELAIVNFLQVFSHHLGFAKRGELGRVNEGKEGVGVEEGLTYTIAWQVSICVLPRDLPHQSETPFVRERSFPNEQ